jgi:Mg/Co/Ni transporter MgtE
LPTPDRVIDWAAIQPFGEPGEPGAEEGGTPQPPGSPVRLRTSHEGLARLRPGELADLLEDLRRDERQELLAALAPDDAADALEEMEPEDLAQLLREADPDEAAALVASMEPDEAADALRDLPAEHRELLVAKMPPASAAPLLELLEYPEDRAGGFMTTILVTAHTDDTLEDVAARLAEARSHDVDIDAVAVIDREGRLVADLPLLDVLLGLRERPEARVASVVGDEEPVTVTPDTPAAEVAQQLVGTRRLSLVVVEEDRRPVGRILADDVLDALVPTKGRFHFPRLFE